MNVALRPEHLNILSICTGGAGLDLGVELAIPSARSVCMVEREAFAVAQLVSAMEAGLMAPAPIWSDARTFDGRAWRGAVDGLIGGIPCQPHSLAGKRLGEEDERDLWSTARRIVVQSGAWFVLIENVRGIISSGGAERVWRDLRRLGFQVEGGLFTAAEVGASHERERFFILAVLDDASGGRERRVGGSLSGAPDANEPSRSNGRERDLEYSSEGVSGVGQADAFSEGLEGSDGRALWQQQPASQRDRQDLDNSICVGWNPRRDDHGQYERYEFSPASELALVHAESIRCGEGRSKSELRSRRGSSASAGGSMANAKGGEQRRLREQGSVAGPNELSTGRYSRWVPPFPPGPGDADSWREVLDQSPELEPAFRRVADGLASRLDIARVDRLRMLGNGVVCLEAAYALRTLVTRLAARGSAGAARLVRMMEAA